MTDLPFSSVTRREILQTASAGFDWMYGIGSSDEHQNDYATQALRARRLVEAGVRFIEITCPRFDGNNSPWDQHGKRKANREKNARITDQSVAALIRDLKQRGLLDETLVVWAGEMGRMPHSPGKDGRDHRLTNVHGVERNSDVRST